MFLTVKQIKKETNNSLSIIFIKPLGFNYYPGQYIDTQLPNIEDDGRGKVRAFSLSSSPTETDLMITFKKGSSSFKKALAGTQAHQQVKISHPAGTFILDETEPAVFIAGGVGITPFRSMIKWVFDKKLKTPITLIYSNSDDNFIFKEELEKWRKRLQNLHIMYHNSSQNSRLTRLQSISYPLQSIYYLAGSKSMISDYSDVLKNLGVDEVDIRIDSFDGY